MLIVDLAGLTDATPARVVPADDAAGHTSYMRKCRPDRLVMRVMRGRPAAGYAALTQRCGVLAG